MSPACRCSARCRTASAAGRCSSRACSASALGSALTAASGGEIWLLTGGAHPAGHRRRRAAAGHRRPGQRPVAGPRPAPRPRATSARPRSSAASSARSTGSRSPACSAPGAGIFWINLPLVVRRDRPRLACRAGRPAGTSTAPRWTDLVGGLLLAAVLGRRRRRAPQPRPRAVRPALVGLARPRRRGRRDGALRALGAPGADPAARPRPARAKGPVLRRARPRAGAPAWPSW